MKKEKSIQNILDKFLDIKKKDAACPQKSFWEDIAKEHDDNQEVVQVSKKLDKVFSSVQSHEKNTKQENRLQDLLRKIEYSESANIFSQQKQNISKVLLKVAAVLIPLAIITSALVFYLQSSKTPDYQTVSTQKGSKTKIVLEDGTLIWLNAESELKYPSTFKKMNKRIVNLSGEAYFDVVKNKKKPFEVYVSGYKVNVLGTSFNIKAYPKEETIETTLERGKINIEKVIPENSKEKHQEIITLVPNQTILLYKEVPKQIEEKNNRENKAGFVKPDDKKLEKKQKGKITESEDLSQYTSWKENQLVFKSKSLGELIPDLERWYNIKISVEEDSLKQIICTGKFHNETAEQVIRALCIASKINYEIDKDKVVLKANY